MTRNGLAYGQDVSSSIVAVDLVNAKVLWSAQLTGGTGVWYGPQLAADGSIIAALQPLDGSDHVQLWSLGADGSGRWQCPLSSYPGSVLEVGSSVYAFDGIDLDRYTPTGAPTLASHGWVTTGGGPTGANPPL